MKWRTYYKKIDTELALLVCTVIALILAGLVAYQYRALGNELQSKEVENNALLVQLDSAKDENEYLLEQTREKQAVIENFQSQIEKITSSVGTLEKLARTDEELLKKYSKVYFLNENYSPASLTEIDSAYTFSANGNFLVHAQVWIYLKSLLDAAHKDGLELLVASAFRSFDTQASLKYGYTVTYGTGANQFSADQGYSEHQLGTSVDLTTAATGALFSKFKDTTAYDWLLEHAHEYGFILSYPEGNAYYKFEPWHWRFVGVALATYLNEEGKHFYDLGQREIDAYLVKLFY